MQFKKTVSKWLAVCTLGLGVWMGLTSASRAQDIVIGQIGPFTGIPVPDALQVSQGIKAYVAQTNKAGGINGRKLTFFELDDGYSGDGFVARFNEAMLRKPVALISPIGSVAVKRMLDDKLLDKNDVIVMNAIPGAELFRNPGHPRMFHVRAGDKQQLEKIVNHARTLGLNKLAVFHQDIVIGTSGMRVVAQEVARIKEMEAVGVQSTAKPEDLAKGSAEVLKLNAKGVIVVGSPPFMANAVAQLRKAGVSQIIFVLSYVPPGLLVKLAGSEGARGVGIAQTYPNPNGHTKSLLREFQAGMELASPEIKSYTPFQLEGYVSARIVGEAVRRAKDSKADTLVKTIQTMGEIDFGGYRIDFSKDTEGSHWVDIAVVDQDGRLRY